MMPHLGGLGDDMLEGATAVKKIQVKAEEATSENDLIRIWEENRDAIEDQFDTRPKSEEHVLMLVLHSLLNRSVELLDETSNPVE